MIGLYTRKPVIIEAVQWKGWNTQDMEKLGVLAGLDSLTIGSFVIKNERGKLEVFSESAFNETFKKHLVWEDNI